MEGAQVARPGAVGHAWAMTRGQVRAGGRVSLVGAVFLLSAVAQGAPFAGDAMSERVGNSAMSPAGALAVDSGEETETLGAFDKIKQGVKEGARKIKEGAKEGGRKIKEGAKEGAEKVKRAVNAPAWRGSDRR